MSLPQIHLEGKVSQYKEKLEQIMERFFHKLTSLNHVVRFYYGIETDVGHLLLDLKKLMVRFLILIKEI